MVVKNLTKYTATCLFVSKWINLMCNTSLNLLGPGDVANDINERISSPVTSTKEQLVPNIEHTTVKCSCGFNGVCILSSPNLKMTFSR